MIQISIIIPCYNQGDYVADAIESALAQTVQPIEVIVIDDGSTDYSLAVARSYEKEGVKVIHQVNKGLSSARNTGIMNATGDYIFPLDADDMMKENCLEKILETIDKTNADIVAPSFKTFGIQNNEVILNPKACLEDFKQANYIGYFSAIRKSTLLEVGGYSPRMVWGYEDMALWIDLLKRGAKLVILQDVLVMYRTKEQSMIHTAQQHHEELMNQIRFDHKELYE